MIAERGQLLPEMVIRLLAKDELAMILPLVQELNPGVPPDVLAQTHRFYQRNGYQIVGHHFVKSLRSTG